VDNPVEPNERKKDDTLNDQLDQENSGILAWLVRGYLEYQQIGIQRPALVLASTESYRQSEDTIGDYIGDNCYTHPLYQVPAKKLYEDYAAWSKDNGLKPMSSNLFGTEIATRFKKMHSNRGNIYTGIGLATENEPPSESEGTSEGSNKSEGTSEGLHHAAKAAPQANLTTLQKTKSEGGEGISGKVSHGDQKNGAMGENPESAFTAFTSSSINSGISPTDKPSHNKSEGSNVPSLAPSLPSLFTKDDHETFMLIKPVLERSYSNYDYHNEYSNGQFLKSIQEIISSPNPTEEQVKWAKNTMIQIVALTPLSAV
jgi:hypothetical protein